MAGSQPVITNASTLLSKSQKQKLHNVLSWLADFGAVENEITTHGETTHLSSTELAEVLWLSQLLRHRPNKEEASPRKDEVQNHSQPRENIPTPPDIPSKEERNTAPKPSTETRDADLINQEEVPDTPKANLLPEGGLPDDRDGAAVLQVWLEDPPLIHHSLQFLRGMGPLFVRTMSRRQLVLDEPETVESIARQSIAGGFLSAVMTGIPEAQYELVLAIDGGLSMRLWDRLVPELKRLFASGGGFRHVRLLPICKADGNLRPTKELQIGDPESRTLVLLLSDCSGWHWWNGSIFPLLQGWSKRLPVAVLQVLPRRMWCRTALGLGEEIVVRNYRPGQPSASYKDRPLRRRVRPNKERNGLNKTVNDSSFLLPVLSCDSVNFHSWSAVVVGDSRRSLAGFRMPMQVSGTPPTPDPLVQLKRFRDLASPAAVELASVYAAAPVLTLPVMRLLKKAFLSQDHTPTTMAEVLLSGLLEVKSGQKNSFPEADRTLQLNVKPAVKPSLLGAVQGETIATVINMVSKQVEQRWNRLAAPENSFKAFLTDPLVKAPPEFEGWESFGEASAELIAALGGRYTEFAGQLKAVAMKKRRVAKVISAETEEIEIQLIDGDELGIQPVDIQGASSNPSLDFRSALQVAPARIARLRDAELGELMGQLLRAQSHRCGAPLSEVRTNTEEKAADGGADAWSGKPEFLDKWLGDAETCWQLKAGLAGTPHAVKREIGKSLPSATLKKGGRFVLVASGSTSGKKGEINRLETLTKEAYAAGLPTDRIVVIGSERLTEWVNENPAIAARWSNRFEGFWSLQDWPAQEHHAPWQAIDPVASSLAKYRKALDPTVLRNDSYLHLHLHGPPGSGKTRLALELCKQAPWADFVVYVQQARESNVLSLLAQAASEEGVRLVVVADDTPAELLKPLRDVLERSEGRIRLITLGTSHSPDPRRIRELAVEPLPTDSLSQLLGCWYPAMSSELVRTAVNLAAGNPRLARLAADALNQNPSHTTATLTEQPAIRDLRPAIASHGRSDWSWPKAWDFTTYRSEKRQGFVGRQWLFEKVRAWATNPDGEQALLIGADYGVGKSAFLAELLDTGAAGLPVVAHHFCRADISDTLEAGRFVRSLASQLAEALPAYRALLEADDAKELRETLDQANQKPQPAFDQAVLAPLRRIEAPATQVLLVIDALDEALDHVRSGSGGSRSTIVDLLAKEARNLPSWLRVLATSRRRDEVLKPLRQGFSIEEINAEEARNLTDIHAYVKARCQQEPLAPILSRAGLSPSETADVLQAKSSGKFFYAVGVLSDLERGFLPLASRDDLETLPSRFDHSYLQTFERRFPKNNDYSPVQPVLALLCAQREPMGYGQLAAILEVSIDQIGLWIEPLQDLLRFRATPPSERASESEEEWRISFDHASLEQWLTERSGGHIPRPRAGRFGVNREVAEQQIRTWALAEVEAKRAHTSPYLVRHLASHLQDHELAEVMACQLMQFPWLHARLQQTGVELLLNDFDLAKSSPALILLERILRQSSHVFRNKEGDVLASHLLAALPEGSLLGNLRSQANAWILTHMGGMATSSVSSQIYQDNCLLQVLVVGSAVNALMALSDGRIISGSDDKVIRIWNTVSGSCIASLEGHEDPVISLAVLGNGCLASGSDDETIRLWDLESGKCTAVLKGHTGGVASLVPVYNGCLASGSADATIRLWDTASGRCTGVLKGHEDWVFSLALLEDARLASGSDDNTIRLWDLKTGVCNFVLQGHEDSVSSLVVLRDGRIASGSRDETIRLWDQENGECIALIDGHERPVNSLALLASGLLAAGTESIWIWDLSKRDCVNGFLGPVSGIRSIVELRNDRLASGSADGAIRIWDTSIGSHVNK
jgi:hypothetical protein